MSTRRLAAILAADVAGYSRLMGGDEEGTLAVRKAHRRELTDPKIEEHRLSSKPRANRRKRLRVSTLLFGKRRGTIGNLQLISGTPTNS
jgi:class 3 adenylate cyclase